MIARMATSLDMRTGYGRLSNIIGGREMPAAGDAADVHDPSTGAVIAQVPLSGAADVDAAVQAAKRAFPEWAATPIKERVRIFYEYRTLLERNVERMARLIHEENGKVRDEAVAEVMKSIEQTEFACSLPQIVQGRVLEVSRGIECRIDRRPLGVVASITPFNFPAMVPNWTIPNAIALGNCLILKPSESVPLTANLIAELLRQAGLPPGVFNVVHGVQPAVEALCDHPDIAAVSFVGSTRVAKTVYRRATAQLKRALALGGAKNHLIVLPDADREATAANVVASMAGCAGQRCMAASVMVAVHGSDPIIERLIAHARSLVPGESLGPVISREAKARIERYIDEAEAEGARVLLDGRGLTVPGHEGGFWIGPTILDRVSPDSRIAQEEVFGPVLAIVRVSDLDEALAIENRSPYGNAAAVYTESGGLAREVIERASAGMIGVNVGVPVPREPFSFGGWNESRFGVGDITGEGSIEFWTQAKKTTVKWNRGQA